MLNIESFSKLENRDFSLRCQEYEFILKGNKYMKGGLNLEFGVFKGYSITECATLRPDLTFWGFDSFEGLPELWDVNESYTCTRETHSLRGQTPEVPKNVKLVKGWFNKTLPDWWAKHKGNISFLNMDADLYSSTIYVLKTINEGIIPGTIIRFDELSDWRLVAGEKSADPKRYTKWQEGEWKALNEWIDEYKREVQPIARNTTYAATIRVVK